VVVEDDGVGEFLRICAKKKFSPFSRTKNSGTGLGLAIVARRASGMPGRKLEFESPVKMGEDAVLVRLPLGEETRMKTILIVDDEPAARYGLQERWRPSTGSREARIGRGSRREALPREATGSAALERGACRARTVCHSLKVDARAGKSEVASVDWFQR